MEVVRGVSELGLKRSVEADAPMLQLGCTEVTKCISWRFAYRVDYGIACDGNSTTI